MPFWERLYAAHHRPHTATYQWAQGILSVLAVVSVATLFWELSLPEGDAWLPVLAISDQVILVVFAVDLIVRLMTYRPPALKVFNGSMAWRLRMHIFGRIRYLFTPLVFLDLITVASLVPALRGLRALRLMRALSALRVFKYSNPVLEIVRSLSESWILYGSTMGFLLATVTIGGLSIYLIERGLNPQIQSMVDAFWWALVTVTTVGFGDIAPATSGGRLVGGVVMVAGMFTLALFAGVVSTTLLNVMFSTARGAVSDVYSRQSRRRLWLSPGRADVARRYLGGDGTGAAGADFVRRFGATRGGAAPSLLGSRATRRRKANSTRSGWRTRVR